MRLSNWWVVLVAVAAVQPVIAQVPKCDGYTFSVAPEGWRPLPVGEVGGVVVGGWLAPDGETRIQLVRTTIYGLPSEVSSGHSQGEGTLPELPADLGLLGTDSKRVVEEYVLSRLASAHARAMQVALSRDYSNFSFLRSRSKESGESRVHELVCSFLSKLIRKEVVLHAYIFIPEEPEVYRAVLVAPTGRYAPSVGALDSVARGFGSCEPTEKEVVVKEAESNPGHILPSPGAGVFAEQMALKLNLTEIPCPKDTDGAGSKYACYLDPAGEFNMFSAMWQLHAMQVIEESFGKPKDVLNSSTVKALSTWKLEAGNYVRNYSSMDTSTAGGVADARFWGLTVVYRQVGEGGLVMFRTYEIDMSKLQK